MNLPRSEYESNKREHGFPEKMKQLLPDVEFEETAEMIDARTAVLEALRTDSLNPDLLRSVWAEYAIVCEQAVDNEVTEGTVQRAQLQIAALIHKSLIFREMGDMQRYREELAEAEVYSFNMHLDAISEAMLAELEQT